MFSGFVAKDFDAYASNKWKSNVFNRERLDVKQRVLELGRVLQTAMIGADGAPLELETSAEHPALWNHKQVEAQHLFFSRNQGSRKELDKIMNREKGMASLIEDPTPMRNHLFLALTLGHDGIDLALKLHPDASVDRQNLERKLDDHFEKERFIRMLGELGAPFVAGVTPELTSIEGFDDARANSLIGALAATTSSPLGPQKLLHVGRSFARAEAIALGEGFVENAQRTFAQLLPLYHFIAWSRDNDHVSMRETLQKDKQQKRQKGIGKNDQVRIVRGMFAGKLGVVQDVDGKGEVKLLIGTMAVKLDVVDVVKP
jgi:hypothetical protein